MTVGSFESIKLVCGCAEIEMEPSPRYGDDWFYCPKCARYVKMVRR